MTTPTTLQRHAPRSRSRTRVRTWIKRSALLAAGIAAVSGLVYAWLPSPVSVDVDVVSRAPLSVEIVEDGRTRVRDRYVVSAPTAGNLKRIELEAGASVAAGDVVAWIEPPVPALLDARMRDEAVARLTAASAHYRRGQTEVKRAQVTRDLATKEAQRALTLAARGAIAGSERDRLETEAQLAIRGATAAQTELAAASAEIAAARAVLGQGSTDSRKPIPVMAPASGRILRILRDSAGPIAGGMGLVEIGDPRAMEVVVDVLSADAARIRTGMEATIENWGGDPVRGRVRMVEPSGFTRISALGVEEQRVNVVVAIEPPGGTPPVGSISRQEMQTGTDDSSIALGDGYRVDVRISIWRGADVLAVPTSAVFRHQNVWAVYIVDNGRAVLRNVQLSHRGRNRVEIAGGILEGARVVLHPGDRVTPGARVRAR